MSCSISAYPGGLVGRNGHPRKSGRRGVEPRCAGSGSPAVFTAFFFLTYILGGSYCVARGELSVNCCSGAYAAVDCSSGVDYLGQHYFCMGVETPEMRACVSCIPPTSTEVSCSSCCGTTDSECDLEWSWGAVLATLSVSAVFATCSGILALAESRRKRKGISLARAWSLPQGMPVLRATVVDLSDAMRRGSAIWNTTGLNGEGDSEEDELEHVGLLEEIPQNSIYGALVGQGDADIPVAKLAEDNWVTAMAWGQTGDGQGLYEQAEEPEAEPPVSPPSSLSRWRSARAIARQARRLRSATSLLRNLGPIGRQAGPEGDWSVDGEEDSFSSVVYAEDSVRVRDSSSPRSGDSS